MQMSKRQEEEVARIARLTGVRFTGTTHSGAERYLKRHAYMVHAADKRLHNPYGAPTQAQIEYIDQLMAGGAPTFVGRTLISAACYIEHYRNKQPLKLSDAQKRAVSMCRDYADAVFEGTTYDELREFLNTHMPRATAAYAQKKEGRK